VQTGGGRGGALQAEITLIMEITGGGVNCSALDVVFSVHPTWTVPDNTAAGVLHDPYSQLNPLSGIAKQARQSA
jgi:hypothetical protein